MAHTAAVSVKPVRCGQFTATSSPHGHTHVLTGKNAAPDMCSLCMQRAPSGSSALNTIHTLFTPYTIHTLFHPLHYSHPFHPLHYSHPFPPLTLFTPFSTPFTSSSHPFQTLFHTLLTFLLILLYTLFTSFSHPFHIIFTPFARPFHVPYFALCFDAWALPLLFGRG